MTDESAIHILFVDLDGTLVATDVMREALLLAGRRNPWVFAQFLVWARRGRASAKRALAQRVSPDPERLPYHEEVLVFLREERARGRTLVLATASDRLWAEAVARHVDLFDDVLASDGQRNLKGTGKLDAIQAYCRIHGFEAYAYMGDAKADLPIWEQAAQIYVVAPTRRLLGAIRNIAQPTRIFDAR